MYYNIFNINSIFKLNYMFTNIKSNIFNWDKKSQLNNILANLNILVYVRDPLLVYQ